MKTELKFIFDQQNMFLEKKTIAYKFVIKKQSNVKKWWIKKEENKFVCVKTAKITYCSITKNV